MGAGGGVVEPMRFSRACGVSLVIEPWVVRGGLKLSAVGTWRVMVVEVVMVVGDGGVLTKVTSGVNGGGGGR